MCDDRPYRSFTDIPATMYVRSDKLQKHKPNEVFVFLRGGATERVSAALLLGASLAQSATTTSCVMGVSRGLSPLTPFSLGALYFQKHDPAQAVVFLRGDAAK